MMKIRYALFDLDGTLTASAPGITRSVQYALSKLGIEEPDLAKLEDFVGPPLSYSFDRHYHLSESDIVKAVEYFRERYAVTGIFENDLYPGIDEMMMEASRCGVHTAVASSKPEEHVLTVLKHFNISQYFDVICGSKFEREADGVVRPSDKSEIVRRALDYFEKEDPDYREHAVMVGDRSYDIEGALSNKVFPVGVTYGYGPREELVGSGARFIADNVEELEKFLTTGSI